MKKCDIFVTEQMVSECFDNDDLVRQAAVLEGAKLDMALKNFMKEGKDYKGLKKDLRDIIKANNLDDDDLKTGKKGFMHACKRIMQVLEDFCAVAGTASNVGSTIGYIAMGANPAIIIGAIVGTVVGFICNRLFRLLWDTIEFNAVKDDAEDIVSTLRRMAKNTNDPKLKKKYDDEADRLEDSIKKYSKKAKKED